MVSAAVAVVADLGAEEDKLVDIDTDAFVAAAVESVLVCKDETIKGLVVFVDEFRMLLFVVKGRLVLLVCSPVEKARLLVVTDTRGFIVVDKVLRGLVTCEEVAEKFCGLF